MSAITINPEQFAEFAKLPQQGPVIMLNLLKFKTRATGEEGTGAEAYGRYGEGVAKIFAKIGARPVWVGRPMQVLIGGPEANWDVVALVEYPNRQAFIDMVTRPDYQGILKHREAGLEYQVLAACEQTAPRR